VKAREEIEQTSFMNILLIIRRMDDNILQSESTGREIEEKMKELNPELFRIVYTYGGNLGRVSADREFNHLSVSEQESLVMETLYHLDEFTPEFKAEWEAENPDKIARTLSEQLIRKAYRMKR
jgi:hypothetical protein